MNPFIDAIRRESSALKDEMISLRRHFHKYPELSYHEFQTASFIIDWLEKNKIEYTQGIAETGIIAKIRGGKKSNRIIAIRAEMDALPVTERNTGSYSSANTGIMHACGHDAHMAMLMGTGLLLKKLDKEFRGTVLLIFQPGEEQNPGGARKMIESGVFRIQKPDLFIAQHVLPELESGKVGYKAGRYMASCDEIYITVEGTGGHAALPALTTDQVFIASNLVVRLKNIMAERQIARRIPTILGIGRIIGEGATNVIPEKVEIAGTLRTFDEKWRIEAKDLIRRVADVTAKEFDVKINVRISEGYPVLFNDEALTNKAINLSRELLGYENVETFDIRMSSDDFSFYSDIAPSLYYRVGIKRNATEMKKLHTPDFDIDEEAMVTGTANLSWLLYNLLNER